MLYGKKEFYIYINSVTRCRKFKNRKTKNKDTRKRVWHNVLILFSEPQRE